MSLAILFIFCDSNAHLPQVSVEIANELFIHARSWKKVLKAIWAIWTIQEEIKAIKISQDNKIQSVKSLTFGWRLIAIVEHFLANNRRCFSQWWNPILRHSFFSFSPARRCCCVCFSIYKIRFHWKRSISVGDREIWFWFAAKKS